jgi:hypothetical protein
MPLRSRSATSLLKDLQFEVAAENRADGLDLSLVDYQLLVLPVCHGKDKRRWFRRANMVPEWWFPREDLDADSFAFRILHCGASEDTFPRKNGAGAWFGFRNVDRYEVFEQSFPLPNNEVLTIITVPEDGLS